MMEKESILGFRQGAYAKVWEVKPNPSGRSTSVRLSISKKAGGGYEEEYSGYAAFIATANTQAATLKPGDRIKLGDVDVSSRYSPEKREKTYGFKVFSFELADGPQGARTAGSTAEDGGLPDDFPA